MLLALRREEEVAVDLVEIAAVDMEEEEETDTAEEVAGEAAVMKEEGVEVIEDMVEAAAVAATEAAVDMITAADTTITTGTEVTDTMAEVEVEDVAMEAGVVAAMGAAVDTITEVVMVTEMVVTKESCISQQHDHTLTSRAGSNPPCPSLCGEFSCNFCVFSICLQFYVAFLNPF